MATPEATILTANERLAGINDDYEQRYGFRDAEHYVYKAPKGLNRSEASQSYRWEPWRCGPADHSCDVEGCKSSMPRACCRWEG